MDNQTKALEAETDSYSYKTLELDDGTYVFDTLEDLVLALKDANYEVALKVKKKGRIQSTLVKL